VTAARYVVRMAIETDADPSGILEAAQVSLSMLVLSIESQGAQVIQATEDDVEVSRNG
jgi:hypothetical protein